MNLLISLSDLPSMLINLPICRARLTKLQNENTNIFIHIPHVLNLSTLRESNRTFR